MVILVAVQINITPRATLGLDFLLNKFLVFVNIKSMKSK